MQLTDAAAGSPPLPSLARTMLVTLLLLLSAVHGSSAAFPAATDSLIGELARCVPAAQSDIDCIAPLKAGLQRLQTFVQDAHDVRVQLQALSTAVTTAKTALGAVSVLPAIGAAAKALDQVLTVVKPTVDRANGVSASIDGKLWPHKPRIDSLLAAVDRTTSALTLMKRRCDDGAIYTRRARDCLATLRSGAVRDGLTGAAEAFSSSIQPPTQAAVQGMTRSGSACNTLRSFTSRTWADLRSMKSALDSFSRSLDPIISGLRRVKDALEQQVCLPISSPAELAEEAAEKLNPVNWFGKRKRTVYNSPDNELAAISASRRDAHALLKRSWCVSVQDVINGANSALSAFLGPAQKLLDKALAQLPSFTLPGMPDMTALFNIDLSFSIPSLDLNLDFSLVDPFANLNFQCPIDVSTSCNATTLPSSASISICSRSLGQYTPTTTTTTTESPRKIIANWLAWMKRILGVFG